MNRDRWSLGTALEYGVEQEGADFDPSGEEEAVSKNPKPFNGERKQSDFCSCSSSLSNWDFDDKKVGATSVGTEPTTLTHIDAVGGYSPTTNKGKGLEDDPCSMLPLTTYNNAFKSMHCHSQQNVTNDNQSEGSLSPQNNSHMPFTLPNIKGRFMPSSAFKEKLASTSSGLKEKFALKSSDLKGKIASSSSEIKGKLMKSSAAIKSQVSSGISTAGEILKDKTSMVRQSLGIIMDETKHNVNQFRLIGENSEVPPTEESSETSEESTDEEEDDDLSGEKLILFGYTVGTNVVEPDFQLPENPVVAASSLPIPSHMFPRTLAYKGLDSYYSSNNLVLKGHAEAQTKLSFNGFNTGTNVVEADFKHAGKQVEANPSKQRIPARFISYKVYHGLNKISPRKKVFGTQTMLSSKVLKKFKPLSNEPVCRSSTSVSLKKSRTTASKSTVNPPVRRASSKARIRKPSIPEVNLPNDDALPSARPSLIDTPKDSIASAEKTLDLTGKIPSPRRLSVVQHQNDDVEQADQNSLAVKPNERKYSFTDFLRSYNDSIGFETESEVSLSVDVEAGDLYASVFSPCTPNLMDPIKLLDLVKMYKSSGIQSQYFYLTNEPFASKFDTARNKKNSNKNRYTDVLAYDSTRVKLKNNSGSDYINASHVNGYKHNRAYIACQGPTSRTISDFWLMVWQQQVRLIVMTTRLVEKQKTKCATYWPTEENTYTTEHKGWLIHNLKTTSSREKTITTLRVVNQSTGKYRIIVHLLFLLWPDYGVPSSTDDLIDFLFTSRKIQEEGTSAINGWKGHPNGPPLIIHCSAGVGRSGTFMCADICMRMLDDLQLVNVQSVVRLLRTQRAFAVQTAEQYAFCHTVVLAYAKQIGLIPSDQDVLNVMKE